MAKYYCHECGMKLGLLIPPTSLPSLIGTSEQLVKFIKHTHPTGTYNINSVFSDPSYNKYSDYVVNTLVSGSVQIDDKGRLNVIWLAGEQTGFTFIDNQPSIPTDAVLVAWHNNKFKIHAFPLNSYTLFSEVCSVCGKSIII